MPTKPKTILEVESIPSVDIDFMNNTHFEEIKMVNELGKLISAFQKQDTHSNDEIEQISLALQRWLAHTIPHFDRENQLMQETGFPALGVHSQEHDMALDRMKNIIQGWEQHQDIELLADYVFSFWPNWFNDHVNTMDMMTAKFAVMNGFDPHTSK